EREMATLESALEEVLAGNGQVVGVVAEAGTGKSRLCAEFVARCRARGLRVNEAHCPAHGKTIPYLPLLEMLRDIFEIGERDSDHEARRKIAGELMLLDETFQALLPLLFEFLGVGDPARPAPTMRPEARQQQLFAFVRHHVEARSAREPVVLLLDDLHWIDPGSDAFLAHAVEAAANTRTLWLVNFRPEYHAEWMSRSWYRQLPLRPLGPEATAELLADLIGRDSSLAALPARIHERTGGNPFFIEEVVQSLVEDGSLSGGRGSYRLVASTETLQIPSTVESVLAARIDRLDEREKRLLQTAAVIGKEFAAPLLREVAELSEGDLAASLAALVRAEFVIEKALYPEAEYAFKHPLTQEVALHSQLATRRAALHAAVARALEVQNAERLDERAALLAYHWEEAGDALTASRWHARAARVAGLESAREGMRHWERVWELLRPGAQSTESRSLRSQAAVEILKLGVRVGLGQDRAEEIYVEAKALAVESGRARAQVSLGYAFGLHFMLGGAPLRAVPIFEEAVAVADRTGDPELRYVAREPLQVVLSYLGDFARALHLSDEVLALTRDDLSLGAGLLSFSAAFSFHHRGLMLGELGRFAEAADLFARCDEGAGHFGDREMQSWSNASWARMLARAGDAAAALVAGRRAEEGAEKVGSPFALAHAHAQYGMALHLAGDPRGARDRLLRALEMARANRVALTNEADFLAALAEAQLGAGDAREARTTAEEAVRVAERLGTRMYELHAQLARARVLLALDGAGAAAEIEATLERASALVGATGARSYEPEILEVRARLASALSDAAMCERQLREAERLYADMGATGHAERLARELAANT
ncbi:MAG: ATP-binding protein, partial [Myxococcota bacterium]